MSQATNARRQQAASAQSGVEQQGGGHASNGLQACLGNQEILHRMNSGGAYVVVKGDDVGMIAQRGTGDASRYEELLTYNQRGPSDWGLEVGDTLLIPPGWDLVALGIEVEPPAVEAEPAPLEVDHQTPPAKQVGQNDSTGRGGVAPRPGSTQEEDNPLIPNFIEPVTDWLSRQWDNFWDDDEVGQAPAPSPPVHTWWDTFRTTQPRDARQQLVAEAAQRGEMTGHFQAISPEQRRGELRDPYQQALDLYQLHATERVSGRNLGQMAQTQADYMTAEDERMAREAAGGGEITPEQLELARNERLEQDYAPEAEEDGLRWPRMSEAERNVWNTRGAAAKEALLEYLRANHPDFDLSDNQIVVNFAAVEAENAVAYNDGMDHCVIGFDVVQAVERNPAFAVSTVVHELFGHNEFDRGFSVSEELFKRAVARQRGIDPADVVLSRDEWSRFTYFESEIASLVWEFDLYVGSDAAGQVNPLASPAVYLATLLNNMRGQWAPDLVGPLVSGLHARFVADPDLSDAAVRFFAGSCRTHLGITP